MIAIDHIDKKIAAIPALNVAAGNRGQERIEIPVHHGLWPGMPQALEALILTADLQMRESGEMPPTERALLGVVVAERLEAMAADGKLPSAKKTGVLLAGDFYTDPALRKRGTTGNVEEVWKAFAERFRWVVGVAGNHDLFRERATFGDVFRKHANIFPLDGDVMERDGLCMGGISGIIGNLRKPWRHDEASFHAQLREILTSTPDILLVHEGPNDPAKRYRGNAFIRERLLDGEFGGLLVNGHCHWPEPITRLSKRGPTVINVDARVVVLTRTPLS